MDAGKRDVVVRHFRRGELRLVINQAFHSIQDFVAEYASDLSLSGVFIRTDEPLPVGLHVELRFSVIEGDFATIEGVGRVVRAVRTGARRGMGISFVHLTEQSRAVLLRVCGSPPT